MERRTTKLRRAFVSAGYNGALRHLPHRPWGRLRAAWLRRWAASFGAGSGVAPATRVLGLDGLRVGSDVFVSRAVTLDARGGLHLEDGCLIGVGSLLLTFTHRSERADTPVQWQGMRSRHVRVGARAWLGARVIVLPGVTIGEAAIVGAGSVVTKDVPAYAVAAGVPARVLGDRRDRDGRRWRDTKRLP